MEKGKLVISNDPTIPLFKNSGRVFLITYPEVLERHVKIAKEAMVEVISRFELPLKVMLQEDMPDEILNRIYCVFEESLIAGWKMDLYGMQAHFSDGGGFDFENFAFLLLVPDRFTFKERKAVYGNTVPGDFGIVRAMDIYFRGTIIHEFGHLLGRYGHCKDPECIMGYANMDAEWFCKECAATLIKIWGK